MLAYHFLGKDLRSVFGSSRWKEGQTKKVRYKDRIILCEWGFHGSPSLWKAYKYVGSLGEYACKVELGRIYDQDTTKYVSDTRTLIRAAYVVDVLRALARDAIWYMINATPFQEGIAIVRTAAEELLPFSDFENPYNRGVVHGIVQGAGGSLSWEKVAILKRIENFNYTYLPFFSATRSPFDCPRLSQQHIDYTKWLETEFENRLRRELGE